MRTKSGLLLICLVFLSCQDENEKVIVQGLSGLKRGDVVSCGPQDGEMFGNVSFSATLPEPLREDFNIAIALLHSFEYSESEKMFARVIDQAPDCAMAYWGVAMSNFHPLWAPPTAAELRTGMDAIRIARSLKKKTKREEAYIDALWQYYDAAATMDQGTAVQRFEKAMEALYRNYPGDTEAAVFYSLALNAAADPKDKTYAKQKKAIGILQQIFDEQPLHPGIAHYIIHNSDYPELAQWALPAARKYAFIAPASAHAQHMPSHIFTRLGLWQECINSNLVSASSARCYAEKAGLKGHWDEELHAMDYLVYAYLQSAKDDSALYQINYLRTINRVEPLNFKTAYAFAAMPARYLLERKQWKEAASYQLHPADYPWEKFSWQQAILHFTRMMGSIHTRDLAGAEKELAGLKTLAEKLRAGKAKEAALVEVQVKSGEAWLLWRKGNADGAIELMKAAADLEDGTEKHPVTPGEILPARELLAEMLLEMKKPEAALAAFEQNLQRRSNRLNSLYGAGLAAQLSGDQQKALMYFEKLSAMADPFTKRKAVIQARAIMQKRMKTS